MSAAVRTQIISLGERLHGCGEVKVVDTAGSHEEPGAWCAYWSVVFRGPTNECGYGDTQADALAVLRDELAEVLRLRIAGDRRVLGLVEAAGAA